MQRTSLSTQELDDKLTSLLQAVEGLGSCRVSGVRRLREPDSDGCNWSADLFVNTAGLLAADVEPEFNRILLSVRTQYNVV